MKPLCHLLVAVFLFPVLGYNQNLYTLSGHVVDEKAQAVQTGEATLLRKSDSAVIKKAVITNGEFIMDTTASGVYFLRVTALGFEHNLINVRVDESKLVPIRLVRQKP